MTVNLNQGLEPTIESVDSRRIASHLDQKIRKGFLLRIVCFDNIDTPMHQKDLQNDLDEKRVDLLLEVVSLASKALYQTPRICLALPVGET